MPSCVLGMDLGTSSLKVVVVDGAGRIRAASTQSYPTARPHPGWAEQDPADWCQAVRAAVADLRRREPAAMASVVAVGLCSAAHIPVLLDDDRRVIRPAILWSDQRSHEEVCFLKARLGDRLAEITLNEAGCTWTLPQLLWIRGHEPAGYGRVRTLLSSKDYLLYRLTGELATDHASAAATLMFDPRAETWSRELVSLSGLALEALPPVSPALTVAGSVTGEAMREFGLPAGLPVVLGTLDSAAELIGCGVAEPQEAGMIMVGSSGGIMAVTASASHHPGILTYPYLRDGRYYKQAGTNSCATSLQWVRGLVSGLPERGGSELSYRDLDEIAAAVPPGAGGLLFHPYLQGERAPYWNPGLRASFSGIDQGHGGSHFVRAVMEGVAFSLRDCLEMFRRRGLDMRRAVMAGGVAKSPVWAQIITDILGIETYTTGEGESAFGAGLLAATASGLFGSLEEAVQTCAGRASTFAPNPGNADIYATQFARYRDIAGFYNGRTAPA